MQKLEVRLLEKALCRSLGITAVGDDDVELVLVVVQELESISDVSLDFWVLVADRHAWEVLFAETNDCLVNVAEDGLLNTLVFNHLAQNTTVTTSNDKDLLRVWVCVHGKVGDHLLVRELVALGALDDVVEDKDHAVVGGFKDEDILVLGLFMVNHLVDLESHSLARPHVGDFTEPAILQELGLTSTQVRSSITFDGGVCDFAHFRGFGGCNKAIAVCISVIDGVAG